jgi:hypothetical protein
MRLKQGFQSVPVKQVSKKTFQYAVKISKKTGILL